MRVVQLSRMETQRLDELADVVLQDPALAFELLRTINSAQFHNDSDGVITTVRRAMQLVGLNGVRIDPPDGSRFAMRSLQLVLGDPPRRAPEATYLAMLPFIWGNFDARLAEGGGKVLERLEVSQTATAPLAFDLVLSKPADTSTGNYLRLCLRLPLTELPRTRSASWKSVKHGDSGRDCRHPS